MSYSTEKSTIEPFTGKNYEDTVLPAWPDHAEASRIELDRHPEAQSNAEQPPVFPTTTRLIITISTLSLSAILCGLDQTILATAAPRITNDFHALDDIAWWTSAYLLTSATFQLVFGRCNSIFSVKYVYIAANALFAVGSLICTLAQNSATLIVGRAIAGIGVAGIMSGNVLIVACSAPLERRPAILGIMFTWLGIASMIGPFLGGVLADRATWRWCFGVNLPIGAVIIASTVFFIDTSSDAHAKNLSTVEKIRRFDLGGTTLLTASCFCLLFAMQIGATASWRDGRTIASFVVFFVLLLIFIILKKYDRSTDIEAALKNRDVWLAAFYAGLVSGALFIQITYLPVWFQTARNATALTSGTMVTPLIASFVVMSTLSGFITQAIGYYNPAMLIGSIMATIGAGLLTTLKYNTKHPAWIGFQVLYGLGAGACVPPPMLVVQTVLEKDDVPMGVAFVSLVQMLSSAVAVAIAQAIFETALKHNISAIVPTMDSKALFRIGAWQLRDFYPSDVLGRVVVAYGEAVVKVFFAAAAFSAAAFICAVGIRWKTLKRDINKSDNAVVHEHN